jgi:hypothetical protein
MSKDKTKKNKNKTQKLKREDVFIYETTQEPKKDDVFIYETTQEPQREDISICETTQEVDDKNHIEVPIHLKLNLTISEAAAYSNIGVNRLSELLKKPNCPFVLYVGIKKLIKRKEFEEFISKTCEID